MMTRCLAALLGLMPCFSSNASETLRFLVGTNWAAPYGEFKGERLVGGILFDLALALSQATGRVIEQVPLPRRRQEDQSIKGAVDIRCYFAPSWSKNPNAYVWSPPLFDISDVLVRHVSAPPVKSLSEVPEQAVIGTVLGYSYSKVDPYFKSGRLQREDALDQSKLLMKVSTGRNSYGVSNQLAMHWFMRRTDDHQLAPETVAVADYGFHCAIPKLGAVPASEILNALERLSKDGTIKAILSKY